MQEAKKRKKRRMRLPNGIGSVHLIGDGKNRRKPWRARVPSHIEFDADTRTAKQKYITLGYYETEKEAIAALFDYRKDPYTLESATCTFKDVFEMWKDKKYPGISTSGQQGYNAAFKNSTALHDMKMRDIRAIHMEAIMQNVDGKYQVQARLKTFWGQIFKYAMEHDIIQKNYSEFVKTRDKDEGTKRTDIPVEDREKIWAAIDAGDRIAEIAMIYIYTGMRASELLEVRKENVDLENRILVGGMKTEAGTNRRIPLHKDIVPFVSRLMETPGEFLVMRYDKGAPKAMAYQHFKLYYWDPLMGRLGGMTYTCHFARHTCATMMREANVPDDLRKLILGHKSDDITDRYTHYSDAMLRDAIDKIPSRGC
jgi:integrase